MSDITMAVPRYRSMPFGVTRISLREGAPGVRYLSADLALGAYARRVTDLSAALGRSCARAQLYGPPRSPG